NIICPEGSACASSCAIVSFPQQEGHGVGSHPLPRPGETQPLLCGGLHVHPVGGDGQHPGQVVPHLRQVGGQLGALGQNGGVHVAHLESGRLQLFHHPPQQQQA